MDRHGDARIGLDDAGDVLRLARGDPEESNLLPDLGPKKTEVYRMLSVAGLPLPIDYEVWGRSFDGFDVGFLAGLRKHFPADYRKVVDAFPLLECEFYRKELWQNQSSR